MYLVFIFLFFLFGLKELLKSNWVGDTVLFCRHHQQRRQHQQNETTQKFKIQIYAEILKRFRHIKHTYTLAQTHTFSRRVHIVGKQKPVCSLVNICERVPVFVETVKWHSNQLVVSMNNVYSWLYAAANVRSERAYIVAILLYSCVYVYVHMHMLLLLLQPHAAFILQARLSFLFLCKPY